MAPTTACLRDPGTAAGVGSTWWAVMNGGSNYDEPTNIKTSPSSTPVTSSTSSTGGSTSPVTSQSGPLHIPAKRLSAYECMEAPSGVIRHHHPTTTQPWNYPAVDGHATTPFDQYGQPTYYNLADSRGERKVFWNPASSTPGHEYKYSTSATPGTSTTDPPVSTTCHQAAGFSPNAWCNYPYSSSTTRHAVESHHQTTVPYDDRRSMIEPTPPFGHEYSSIRNYPSSEAVPSTPYPPSGMKI